MLSRARAGDRVRVMFHEPYVQFSLERKISRLKPPVCSEKPVLPFRVIWPTGIRVVHERPHVRLSPSPIVKKDRARRLLFFRQHFQ